MAEKVTIMKLKVDLDCEKCYKKVKKLLAKYPQIRDEKFDEKQNIVTITVVCCSPEKMRDKLCCKGGGSIKSIEIVEQPKPKPKPTEAEKTKPAAEPGKKKDDDKPKQDPPKKDDDKPKQDTPKKDDDKPKPGKPTETKPAPPPVNLPANPPVPPPTAVPVGICCVPCYEGRPGGPCMSGYVGPPLYYDGYYARPVYDGYGGGTPYYVSRCDQYLSEENASGCTIM